MVIHIGKQSVFRVVDALPVCLPFLSVIADEQVGVSLSQLFEVAANDDIDQSIVLSLKLPDALQVLALRPVERAERRLTDADIAFVLKLLDGLRENSQSFHALDGLRFLLLNTDSHVRSSLSS